MITRRLSYANAMSTLALFLALGGVSYAAATLPAKSVGSRELKDRAVMPTKVARSTVKLFKGQRGLRGLTGPAGLAGPAGPTGATGACRRHRSCGNGRSSRRGRPLRPHAAADG